MRKNHLRWFDHVHREPIDATISRIVTLELKVFIKGAEDLRKFE